MDKKENQRPAAPAADFAEIQKHLARLESISAPTSSRSLASEYKSIHQRNGRREVQKACGGHGVCQNVLCDHKHAFASATTADEALKVPLVDEKVLGLLMAKLEKDDYLVTEEYAKIKLSRSKGKFIDALRAVKKDIDTREAALINSGRVSMKWERSHATFDLRIKGSTHGTSSASKYALPAQRDALIIILEREDKTLRSVEKDGWNSSFGHSILHSTYYKGNKAKEHAYSMYHIESKFRAKRAEYLKELKAARPDATMECLMNDLEKWDAIQAEAKGVSFFSPFRRAATAAKENREKEAKESRGKEAEAAPVSEVSGRAAELMFDTVAAAKLRAMIPSLAGKPKQVEESVETARTTSSSIAKGKGKAVEAVNFCKTTRIGTAGGSSSVSSVSIQHSADEEIATLAGPPSGDAELDGLRAEVAEGESVARYLQRLAFQLVEENDGLQQQQLALKKESLKEALFQSEEDRPWTDNVEELSTVLKDIENVEEDYYFIDEDGDLFFKTAIMGRVLKSLRKTVQDCMWKISAGPDNKTSAKYITDILDTLRGRSLHATIKGAFADEEIDDFFSDDMLHDFSAVLVAAWKLDAEVDAFKLPLAYPDQWSQHGEIQGVRRIGNLLRSKIIMLHHELAEFVQRYPRGEADLNDFYQAPKPIGTPLEQHVREDLIRLFGECGQPFWYFDEHTKKVWDKVITTAKAIDSINASYPPFKIYDTLPEDDHAAKAVMETAISLKKLVDRKELLRLLIEDGTYPETAAFVQDLIKQEEDKAGTQAKTPATSSSAGPSGSSSAEPARRLLVQIPRHESAFFDRTPMTNPEIKDDLGVWPVEFVYVFLALHDLKNEISGGVIKKGPFPTTDVSTVKKEGGVFTDSAAEMLMMMCSGSAQLAVQFWMKARPIIRRFVVKRGDKDITNTTDEVELMRFGAAVIANRYHELLEKETAEEQLARNNPKALAKANKKAEKKAEKKAAKRAGKK